MKCPFCGCNDTQVKDSRNADDDTAVRRRRECPECGQRFTTFEHVQLRDLMVVKKNGERVMFDREKLARSIYLAVRKRPISSERVEKIVNSIQRRLESTGDSEILSTKIGELTMEALATLDHVAYIRFASVYRDFREPKDFEEFLETLEQMAKPKGDVNG